MGRKEGAQEERIEQRLRDLAEHDTQLDAALLGIRRDVEVVRTEVADLTKWRTAMAARDEQIERNAKRIADAADRQEQKHVTNRQWWIGIITITVMLMGVIVALVAAVSSLH